MNPIKFLQQPTPYPHNQWILYDYLPFDPHTYAAIRNNDWKLVTGFHSKYSCSPKDDMTEVIDHTDDMIFSGRCGQQTVIICAVSSSNYFVSLSVLNTAYNHCLPPTSAENGHNRYGPYALFDLPSWTAYACDIHDNGLVPVILLDHVDGASVNWTCLLPELVRHMRFTGLIMIDLNVVQITVGDNWFWRHILSR